MKTKMKTESKPKIESVSFDYVGEEKQFNEFLRALIRDYLSDGSIAPPEKPDVSEKETK